MNPMDLVTLLRGHKNYIQTHNYPDPDAVASAFGLQRFLNKHGVEATICYAGTVEKLSTKMMFEVFGIDVYPINEVNDMGADDFIVTVDAQKYNANLTDFVGTEVACVDHHPTYVECEYNYKDVRMVGACSSIIAEYYYKTGTPMDTDVASALAYGIKMDTADFMRGVTELDVDMFAYVYKMADVSKISIMYSNVMEFAELKADAAALDDIKVCDKVGFATIPFDCPDGLIAIISEFILSLDVVSVSIVYALRKDGMKFSVRCEAGVVDAGRLIQEALKDIGSGGGHKEMAGGFVPKEWLEAHEKNYKSEIEHRFLNCLTNTLEKA